jgi:hypothetical protein
MVLGQPAERDSGRAVDAVGRPWTAVVPRVLTMAARKKSAERPAVSPTISPVVGRLRQVERVWQMAGEFNRLPVPDESDHEAEFAIFRTGGTVTEDGTELVASVELGFRLTAVVKDTKAVPDDLVDKESGRVVIAFVRGSYMITYGLDDGRDLPAAVVEEFCGLNAVHTAWPFWREFVTSSLLRSGLESMPVPPFTVYGEQKAPVTDERDAGARER